jgi:hypothetical protein
MARRNQRMSVAAVVLLGLAGESLRARRRA